METTLTVRYFCQVSLVVAQVPVLRTSHETHASRVRPRRPCVLVRITPPERFWVRSISLSSPASFWSLSANLTSRPSYSSAHCYSSRQLLRAR